MYFTGKFILLVFCLLPVQAAMGKSASKLQLCEAEQLGDRLKEPSEFICPMVDFHGQAAKFEGKLSPYWAHEMIGADLAREFTDQQSGLRTAKVAIQDQTIDFDLLPSDRFVPEVRNRWTPAQRKAMAEYYTHGTAVANLILGEAPIGMSNQATLVDFHKVDKDVSSKQGLPRDSIREAAQSYNQTRPDLINVSTELSLEEQAKKTYRELESSSITVVASGNGGYSISSYRKDFNLITVGNLNPLGINESGSNFGEEVTISAPSSNFLLSKLRDPSVASDGTNISNFGGTSGATPLVTGSLANAVAILHELKSEEAKYILCKTAIQTFMATEKPPVHGCGMVNAYKIARVAQRLKAKGWPNQRAQLLKDAKIFDFTQEAEGLVQEAEALLQSSVCEKRQQGFKKLREAHLLKETDQTSIRIAQIYRSQGLSLNAAYHDLPTSRGLKTLKDLMSDSRQTPKEEEWLMSGLPYLKRKQPDHPLSKKELDQREKFANEVITKWIDLEPTDPKSGLAKNALIQMHQGPGLAQALIKQVQRNPLLLSSLKYPIIQSNSPESSKVCESLMSPQNADTDMRRAYDASLIIGSNQTHPACVQKVMQTIPSMSSQEISILREKAEGSKEKWNQIFKLDPAIKRKIFGEMQ